MIMVTVAVVTLVLVVVGMVGSGASDNADGVDHCGSAGGEFDGENHGVDRDDGGGSSSP